MKDINKIKEKYKNITFGYFDYKDKEYFVDDFLNEDFVVDWILDTASEADQGITNEGVEFIKEYYGNEYIINKVLEKNHNFTFGYGDPYSFLENHKERSYSVRNQ